MHFDPRHNLQQELFSKTELFEGRVKYLGTFFRGMLFESHNPFILRDLLVPKRRDDINFAYQYYEFPRLPAIATAEQAPAVRVTAVRKSASATMERYSLAVEDSAQAQRTTEGQMILAGKILSMAMGFIEMMEINGFRAMLEQPTFYRRYWLEAQIHDFNFDAKVDTETWQFDALHKTPNGFASLLNAVRQDMAKASDFDVNYVIVPEGTRGLIAAQKVLQDYFIRGNDNQQFADAMADAPAIQNTYPNTNITLRVARGIEFDGADIEYDPLRRQVQIGSHYRMSNFVPKCNIEKWCTGKMDIGVYSMDEDNFVHLTPAMALGWCERFDQSYYGALRSEHYDVAQHANEIANNTNIPTPDHQVDMFIYHTLGDDGKATYNVVDVWGQMEEWALPHETTRYTSLGISRALRQAVGSKVIDAIGAGKEAIDEIFAANVTAEDVGFMALSQPEPEAGAFISKGSDSGGPRLPPANVVAATVGEGNYVPRGFGTVAGLVAIAEQAGANTAGFGYIPPPLLLRAIAFKDAIGKLYDANLELFTERHIMLQPSSAPTAFRAEGIDETAERARAIIAFATNLIDHNKLPIYLAGEPGKFDRLAPPFDDVDDDVRRGAPLAFKETFGTQAALDNFKAQFKASPFGLAYVASQRGTRSRTLRDGGGGGDDDDDGGPVASVPRAQLAAYTDPLDRFHIEYVRPRVTAALAAVPVPAVAVAAVAVAATPAQQIATKATVIQRIYMHVINAVRFRTTPTRIDRALVDSWVSNEAAFESVATALSGDADDPVVGKFYLTRLSLPFDKVKGRADIRLASPLNNGRILNENSPAELEKLRQTSRVDLDLLTVSGARPGYRQQRQEEQAFGEATPHQYGALFSTNRAPITAAAAVFEDTIVDGGRGRLVKNKIAVHRYTRAGRTTNWLERLSEQMFLLAPVLRKVLENFIEKDVPLPVSWLLEMPFHTVVTNAIIFISRSAIDPLGETAHSDMDTHFSRDANRKTFYIHTSLYTASIITDTRRYQVVPDAIVVGYIGGCNTRPILADEFDPAKVVSIDQTTPAMFYIMVPAGCLNGPKKSVARKHDIRGVYNPTVYKYRGTNEASLSRKKPHYPSSIYTNFLFDLQALPTMTPTDHVVFNAIEEFANTVTLQGLQWLYISDDGEGDKVVKPSDHFGDAVIPLYGKLRRDGAIAETYPYDYYKGKYYAE
jgi:hypothetical protein